MSVTVADVKSIDLNGSGNVTDEKSNVSSVLEIVTGDTSNDLNVSEKVTADSSNTHFWEL